MPFVTVTREFGGHDLGAVIEVDNNYAHRLVRHGWAAWTPTPGSGGGGGGGNEMLTDPNLLDMGHVIPRGGLYLIAGSAILGSDRVMAIVGDGERPLGELANNEGYILASALAVSTVTSAVPHPLDEVYAPAITARVPSGEAQVVFDPANHRGHRLTLTEDQSDWIVVFDTLTLREGVWDITLYGPEGPEFIDDEGSGWGLHNARVPGTYEMPDHINFNAAVANPSATRTLQIQISQGRPEGLELRAGAGGPLAISGVRAEYVGPAPSEPEEPPE